MSVAAGAGQGTAFSWLLFGHLVGLAVLGAGLGAYVVGLHRLTAARTAAHLRAAYPALGWGERATLAGYGLLIASGIGLGVKASAFDEAWLLTSLALLVAIAAAGRFSGGRLNRLRNRVPTTMEPSQTELDALLRDAHSLAVHLPVDATVLGIVELVYLMTLRPGAVGIVVSLVMGAVVLAGAAVALGRAVAGPAVAR
ncbi:MAG: hypothetical protein QOI74_3905 [Micromonosporaceae bacterium]|nr:hypothetical protein [Micromonosporaceae bacterium]